jgi:hypothetical protein
MKWLVVALLILAAVTAWAVQPPSPDRCTLHWVVVNETETHELIAPIYRCIKLPTS